MRRHVRGFTLIEVMISMGILAVGMLGLMQLQILGLSWSQSARADSRATELALELRAGLEQLPYGDARLGLTGGGSWGATAPSPFGALLVGGSVPTSGYTSWSDANPIPGVTLDSALERDPRNGAQPRFVRRWTVWGYTSMTSMNAGSLIIAISVIYTDKGSLLPREVVLYTQRVDPAAVLSSIRINS
jgi:prepilin-type N-terminal cleavage/methylation domain-containing protein